MARRRRQLVEEFMHPAFSWLLGINPFIPTPMERHRVIEPDVDRRRAPRKSSRKSNPSPSSRLELAYAALRRSNPRHIGEQLHLDGGSHSEYAIEPGEYAEFDRRQAEYRGDQIRQHFAELRRRRRPERYDPATGKFISGRPRRGKQLPLLSGNNRRRNPGQLHAAGAPADVREMSETFHGTPGEIIRLAPQDRQQLPEYVLDMGAVPEIVYKPDRHSSRGGGEWEHKSGDNGMPFGLGDSKQEPHLVVNPRTRRAQIAYVDSPMKFDPRRGLVK